MSVIAGQLQDPSGHTDDLSDAFWAASLVRRDQPDQIDFSDAAARRGSAWFVLMAHLYWFLRVNEYTTLDEAAVVIDAVSDDSVLDDIPLGSQLMPSIGALIDDGRVVNSAPMGFLMGTLEEPDPKLRIVAAEERIRTLIKALLTIARYE